MFFIKKLTFNRSIIFSRNIHLEKATLKTFIKRAVNMRNSKSEPNLKHSLQSKRLPCRGCTADCKNYAFCDGKPWRQNQAGVQIGSKIH